MLVPARNEERNVGACLALLSAQAWPNLEIIAVDDGSTDGTPAILADAARRDPRVRVLRVDGPPAGWTGKSFALDAGVSIARGAWLCFTDADTVHAPESIARAVGFAERQGVALLSLTSRQLTRSFWERVVQPVVFGLLDQWFPLTAVNDPASPVAPPTGSSSWPRVTPIETRRTPRGRRDLEDVALARRVKAGAGADRIRGRRRPRRRPDVHGPAAIRRGWTKNLYRLRGRRPLPALASLVELGVTLVWPAVGCVVALLAGRRSGWLAALGLGLVLGAEVPFRVGRGDDPRWSPTAPLGAALVALFLRNRPFATGWGWASAGRTAGI